MSEIKRAINRLYEERRDAQRNADKAKSKNNRIEEQRWKREVRRLDGAIKALEED